MGLIDKLVSFFGNDLFLLLRSLPSRVKELRLQIVNSILSQDFLLGIVLIYGAGYLLAVWISSIEFVFLDIFINVATA